MAAPDSVRLAIAAHLHVLLRRKTGRVTDTEWLARNAEYAAEIVRYAREQAHERQAPELAEWAARLEQTLRAPPPPPARAVGVRSGGFPDSRAAEPAPSAPAPAPEDDDGPRYVGGIR